MGFILMSWQTQFGEEAVGLSQRRFWQNKFGEEDLRLNQRRFWQNKFGEVDLKALINGDC